MKSRIFKIMLAVAVMLLVCAGCKKNKDNNESESPSGLSNLTLKKIDLTGVKMLAIADDTYFNGQNYNALYAVNDAGELKRATFTMDLDGDSDLTSIVRIFLHLKVQYIYQIGDDWLWLFDCHHYCSNIDLVDEADRNAIAEFLANYDGIHYLVRKSDGAMFRWSLSDGRPFNVVNYGLESPSDFYGIVEQYDNDIVNVKYLEEYGQIYYLKDNGSNLGISPMLPNEIYPQSVYPGKNDGVVGATIATAIVYGYYNYNPYVIFPSSLKRIPVVVPNYNNSLHTENQMVSVDNSLYVMTTNLYDNGSKTDFRKVEVDLQDETVDVSQPLIEIDGAVQLKKSTIGYDYPVFHGERIAWLQDGKINALYPATSYYTSMDLPEHYPDDAREYIDGAAYVIDNQQNPTSYWVCDMSAGYAMSHNIVMPDLGEYEDEIVPDTYSDWAFDNNSLTFYRNCSLFTGKELNFYFNVTGSDAGQVHVVPDNTGDFGGRVVSTLIKLNGEN